MVGTAAVEAAVVVVATMAVAIVAGDSADMCLVVAALCIALTRLQNKLSILCVHEVQRNL